MAAEANLRQPAVELPLPGSPVPTRELLQHHPADVVAMAGVLPAGIAETDDEQVERRGSVASTPREAHLPGGGGRLAPGARTALCAGLGGRLLGSPPRGFPPPG